MNGVVFDIKRFAVHDGGGIRSTLFLKGCPLRCPWCQNPEGLRREIRIWHHPASCIRCGACVAACPAGALSLNGRVHVDPGRCTACGLCADCCPAAAMEPDGREMTSAEAAALLLRDKPFFGAGGGVTLSGGEALAQPEFAAEVLQECRKAGVDTAVETCLYAPRETLMQLLPLVDHWMADLKLLDDGHHRALLGVSNALILSNYEFLVSAGADLLVRTPLIPGYTAEDETVRAIARYVASRQRNARLELLNFNPLCRSKYAALERAYPVSGAALTAEELSHFYGILRREGVEPVMEG